MRRLGIFLGCAMACGPEQPAPQTIPPTNAAPAPRQPPPPAPADADDDPDHDHIVGRCDLCPNEPETYNGILDSDGCPDSSGTSHAVANHPTNRYAAPETPLTFDGDHATAMLPWAFDDDVEIVAAIGRGNTLALARKRAAIIGKYMRGYLAAGHPNVRVVELATTAARVYDDPFERAGTVEPPSDALVQVIRAGGIDVWRWTGDHLVRATPPKKLEYPPELPRECLQPDER